MLITDDLYLFGKAFTRSLCSSLSLIVAVNYLSPKISIAQVSD